MTALLGEDFNPEDLQEFCDNFDPTQPIVTVDVLDVSCTGDTGNVRIQDVKFLGTEVPLEPGNVPANTPIVPENPLVTVTANQQTTTADDGFSVDGLAVDIGGEAEAIVANATCGETIAAPATDTPAPPAAPAPAPVSGSAPVTG